MCPFGDCLAQDVQDGLKTRIVAKFLAKLRPRCGPSCAKLPKLCPRWLKVVPSWRQDGPISFPKWPIWCAFGGYLAQDRLQTRIEAKFLAKLRPRWAHHGRSWSQVVSKTVQVRAKLAPRWANFASKWPNRDHFGRHIGHFSGFWARSLQK